ncbi:MAG: hypothetical protein F6J95_006055 [Leptolyngbya sp. SIO1E4]|nr:hypothetical protein [Leptolyngbya sp. SIO1E4]
MSIFAHQCRYALLSLGIAALLVVMTSLGGWTWLGSRAIAQVGQEHYLVLISLHTAITQGTANLLSLWGDRVGHAISHSSSLDPHTRDLWVFSSQTAPGV